MALPLVASIGALFLWNNRRRKEDNEPKPSAPPLETQHRAASHISGYIKDSYFYHGESILKLDNLRVSNICVYPRMELGKKYSVTVSIVSGSKKVIKKTITHNDSWINLPGDGLLLYNAVVKADSKIPADLQFTIYYNEV